MTDRTTIIPRTDKPKVVITDYDFGDVSVETEILEAAGAEVIALQAKREEDLFEVAQTCAAMMNQYAKIGRETIGRMQKCEVIARYGVGVDIVDVDTATEQGHPCDQRAGLLHRRSRGSRHCSLALACAQPCPPMIVRPMQASGNGKADSLSIACADEQWVSSRSAKSGKLS